MKHTLIFKRDAQGWQSQHEGKFVVADRSLSYHLNLEGSSLGEHTVAVELEKMLGDFYLAH